MAKESLVHLSRHCIFRETFNSGYAIARNGGDNTDVVVSGGTGSFNGTSSRINYGNKLSLYNIEITINVYIKINTSSTCRILSKEGTSNQRGWALYSLSGRYIAFGDPGGFVKCTTPLPLNKWVNVTITYDNSNSMSGIKIYYDGILKNTSKDGTTNLPFEINSNNLIMGDGSISSSRYSGEIELIELYSKALDSGGVEALHDNSLFLHPDIHELNCLAYYISNPYQKDLVTTFTNNNVSLFKNNLTDVSSFSGSDTSYLDYGDQFDLGKLDLYMSFWIKIHTEQPSNVITGIIGKWRTGSYDKYLLYLVNGKLRTLFMSEGSQFYYDSIQDFRDNQWHFIEFLLDRDANMETFSDGDSLGSINISTQQSYNHQTTNKFFIGAYADGTGLAPLSGYNAKMQFDNFVISNIIPSKKLRARVYNSIKQYFGR